MLLWTARSLLPATTSTKIHSCPCSRYINKCCGRCVAKSESEVTFGLYLTTVQTLYRSSERCLRRRQSRRFTSLYWILSQKAPFQDQKMSYHHYFLRQLWLKNWNLYRMHVSRSKYVVNIRIVRSSIANVFTSTRLK